MNKRKIIHRLIILAFMVLVGFSLANSIRAQSVMGFLLALSALGAGIYFMHLLGKASDPEARTEPEETA